ncbi:MAG: DUF4288 domain-containing protein [Flavitalea sp.]
MNWYMTKIVFRIVCGEGFHTPQFDEQIRLLQAKDGKEAFEKAKAIGERCQDMFLNQNKEMVQWQFINIAELNKLSALIDGAELCSSIHEADHAASYIALVHEKADGIRLAISTHTAEAI